MHLPGRCMARHRAACIAACAAACALVFLASTHADDTIDCSIESINLQTTPAQVAITINDAIVRCPANATHRGVVRLPPGTYRTGSLIVRSNIELHISAGTHLTASLKACCCLAGPTCFRPPAACHGAWLFNSSSSWMCMQRANYGWGHDGMALVRLQNCTRCSVSGSGTLDGRGRDWVAVKRPTRKITRC